MKFVLIAGVICTVFYFCLRTESPRSSKSAAVQAEKNAKPAQKTRTYYSTGLTGKLRAIGNTFSSPELTGLEKSVAGRGITKPYAQKVKKILDKKIPELNKVRSLSLSRDAGANPGQEPDYIPPFRSSLSWLLLSAEYQCKYGSRKQGVNDIASAARTLSIYSSGSTGLAHFYGAAAIHKRLTDTIKRVPLSKAEKAHCLSLLPEKKILAKLLKQTLECEKEPLLSLHGKIREPNADTEKLLDGYSFGFKQTLKEISEEQLKDIYGKYSSKLQQDFEDGTISKKSGSKSGNKREDALLFEYLPLHNDLILFAKQF